MDWLHTNAGIISKGKSAVAASAYQSRSTLTHEQQRTFSAEIEYRKALNEGIVSDGLRQEFKKNGISLSEDTTVEKEGRRHWNINDGKKSYTVKEFRETEWKKDENGEKWINPETNKGKRIERQGLDIHADKTYSYTKASEELKADWIQARNDSPEWIKQVVNDNDRQTYWNRAVKAEQRNGQTAYKLEFALPRDLSPKENEAFVRDWVDKHYTSKGAVVDVAIHYGKSSDGGDNPHCHLLIGTRVATESGFANKKNPHLNSYHNFQNKEANQRALRESLAATMNEHLELAGKKATVNPDSYAKRGINKEPTNHRGFGEGIHRKESKIKASNQDIEIRNFARDFFNVGQPEEGGYLSQNMPDGIELTESQQIAKDHMAMATRFSPQEYGMLINNRQQQERINERGHEPAR